MTKIYEFSTILAFDSKLFGYKVCLLSRRLDSQNLKIALGKLKSTNCKLAYLKIENNEGLRRAAKNCGGFLAEEKVTYVSPINKILDDTPFNDIEKVARYNDDYSRLMQLAFVSGTFSRFRTDPNFHNNEFEKLYTEWIRKSCTNSKITTYIYPGSSDQIAGFITLEQVKSDPYIGLLAVDELYRRRKIGRILVTAACNTVKLFKKEKIYVSTQVENESACRFYENLGFYTHKIQTIYHFWL